MKKFILGLGSVVDCGETEAPTPQNDPLPEPVISPGAQPDPATTIVTSTPLTPATTRE